MSVASDGGFTLGVSLLVPEPWGPQLQRVRLDLGEERALHIPAHITILPPTPVAPAQVDEAVRHVVRVAAEQRPFRVVLRGTGTFRPVSDVVYIQVAQGVSSCERLQARVRSGPLERPLTYPYHPHVTVAHDVGEEELERVFQELAGFRCEFDADHVTVFAHNGDEVWRPLRRAPFGPAPTG